MEKIQIQFTESDYKIYHYYCLRYYQVHDPVRKQSLHAFLDLFEKGIIPVKEQDIRQARQFLSGKCDDLKKEHDGTSGEGEKTTLLQMRICSDLLLLCEDLEKIYRLIQKQGVVANYLMILGTFSKVIEENKNLQLSGIYDLDSDVIESLARPLVTAIRMRLGTDRHWRSVLRELTFIAARFNQRSYEPRFDLDIIQLVAPVVVSHFNKDVQTREILSVLPSYLEESELEEFEAFLNRTPDLLKDYQEGDIDWDAIHEPLEVVASAVAAQRDQWSQGRLKISDYYSLVPPKGTQSPDSELYPAGAISPSQPDLLQAMGSRTFDVAVSPDLPAPVVDTPVVYPPSDFVSDMVALKPRIKPFMPVIIGVAVILLFIVGTAFISGEWDFLGNTTNSTTGALKTTTSTTKATATPTPKATTAKPTATPTPTATTAKPTAPPTPTLQSYSSADIGNHLVEIAFGPDNSGIQKPNKSLVAVSCSGTYTDSDVVLLNNFISQFNDYSSTTKISHNVEFGGLGDIPLNFLPADSLNQIKVDATTSVYKDAQTGTYYFIRTNEKTYVNSDLKGDERKRWILRAALFNLGFLGESAKYSDSLFYAGTNKATQLSAIDLKALQLMYGRKITIGMTKSTVKTTLGI